MTNPKRKRPVKFKAYQWSVERGQYSIQGEGLFHQWAEETKMSINSLSPSTVGIVEDEDGQVYTVNPNNIKFLDK